MRNFFKALDEALAGLLLLGLLGTALYFLSIAFLTLVPPAWDSWSRHYARNQAEEARGDRIRLASHEEYFRTLCPDYYAQPFHVRWTNYYTLRWCEDYRDRF